MSVTNSLGCGQRKGYRESYSGFGLEVKLLKKVQLEIAINEDFVERTIKATIAGARTGQIGDGKVHSHPHGETGGTAI